MADIMRDDSAGVNYCLTEEFGFNLFHYKVYFNGEFSNHGSVFCHNKEDFQKLVDRWNHLGRIGDKSKIWFYEKA